ncbi:MAG TPA: cysteine--tRNA ligase, partial [Candidatus Paceibacterota bacterium]|nr:cysteine--tRNA ligase [Candidatus Paceibacterota bacterium]
MSMLSFFNTLTRMKEPFEPLVPGKAGMYNCGPTVYDRVHIGNLRAYIFSDTLRRVLEHNGFSVIQVMNITDVGHLASDADTGEDKMMKGLKREGLPVTLEG